MGTGMPVLRAIRSTMEVDILYGWRFNQALAGDSPIQTCPVSLQHPYNFKNYAKAMQAPQKCSKLQAPIRNNFLENRVEKKGWDSGTRKFNLVPYALLSLPEHDYTKSTEET
jgi:hypothetical protein